MDIPNELMYIIAYYLEDIDIGNYMKAFPNLDKNDFWNDYIFFHTGIKNVVKYKSLPTKAEYYTSFLYKINYDNYDDINVHNYIDDVDVSKIIYTNEIGPLLYHCRAHTIMKIHKLRDIYNKLSEICSRMSYSMNYQSSDVYLWDDPKTRILRFYIRAPDEFPISDNEEKDIVLNYPAFSEYYAYIGEDTFSGNEMKEIIKQIYYHELMI